MSAPQVSVIVPTHDRRTFLMLTLRTVLWQRGVELEVIVVDDGSADGTRDAVSALDDGRIRSIRHDTPLGVSVARNHGVDVARGAWVAFLDDDDLWAPNKLEAQIQAAAASDATWCYTGAVKIDQRERILGGTPPEPPATVMARLPSLNLVPGGCSGVVANRTALASAGRFDPGLVNLADWDLWIRLGRTGPPACVPEPLVGYRIHHGQASLDVDLILHEATLMEGRDGISVDRGPLHHYLAHRCLNAGWRRKALKHFAHAALLGEIRPVTEHLWAMARFRLAERLSLPQRQDPHAEWRTQARSWLRALEDPGDQPFGDQATTRRG
jgi:glycosyltransferase involved in cell wall biosynthesis